MERALARPTLSVVFGSRRGGIGAGERPSVPPMATLFVALRGSVAYCRCIGWLVGSAAADWELGRLRTGETTVMRTSSPDLRIRSTTCSCSAVVTSSSFICQGSIIYLIILILYLDKPLNPFLYVEIFYIAYCLTVFICFYWCEFIANDYF